jgi:DNA-binding MarR family transcriptional regulator
MASASLRQAAPAHAPRPHRELRIWLRLLGCTGTMERALRRRMQAEFAFSLAQFEILAQLDRFPEGLSMSELSRHLVVSNGAITGHVNRLAQLGFVRRHDDQADRRSVTVRLTPSGEAAFAPMAQRHEEWLVALLGDLSAPAQAELLQSLTLLKRNLDLNT